MREKKSRKLFSTLEIMLVFLILPPIISAQEERPSFNCSKAKTRVEKIICQDNDLSRLDSDLSNIYRKLYEQIIEVDKKELQKKQREWLSQRDKASEGKPEEGAITRLRHLYESRIGELNEWELRLNSHQAPSPPIPKPDNKKRSAYPPYPDIWDWKVPTGDRPVMDFELKAMDNGDVMISYHQDRKDGKFRTLSFFGRTDVRDYKAVYKGDYTNDAKSRIPFKEGMVLMTTGGGWRSGGCYDGLDHHITIRNENVQKLLISKTLLYVFDKPARYVTSPHCMNGPSFDYQVEAVHANFLRLKVGTFLLAASVKDNAYIIRFDENLQTKSYLINSKFFWMDTDDLDRFGAKYGDRAVADKKLRQLYADLLHRLMDVKTRRER